jgi:hypothetical protein
MGLGFGAPRGARVAVDAELSSVLPREATEVVRLDVQRHPGTSLPPQQLNHSVARRAKHVDARRHVDRFCVCGCRAVADDAHMERDRVPGLDIRAEGGLAIFFGEGPDGRYRRVRDAPLYQWENCLKSSGCFSDECGEIAAQNVSCRYPLISTRSSLRARWYAMRWPR